MFGWQMRHWAHSLSSIWRWGISTPSFLRPVSATPIPQPLNNSFIRSIYKSHVGWWVENRHRENMGPCRTCLELLSFHCLLQVCDNNFQGPLCPLFFKYFILCVFTNLSACKYTSTMVSSYPSVCSHVCSLLTNLNQIRRNLPCDLRIPSLGLISQNTSSSFCHKYHRFYFLSLCILFLPSPSYLFACQVTSFRWKCDVFCFFCDSFADANCLLRLFYRLQKKVFL